MSIVATATQSPAQAALDAWHALPLDVAAVTSTGVNEAARPIPAPLAALRHHVTGAIERGEGVAIECVPAPMSPTCAAAIAAWFGHLCDYACTGDRAAPPEGECPAASRAEAVEALTIAGWADPEGGADLHKGYRY